MSRGWTAADYRRDANDQVEEHNAAMRAEALDARDQDADAAWGFLPSATGERVTRDDIRSDDA